MGQSLIQGNANSFQFKANLLPCTILQLFKIDFENLRNQLIEIKEKAPQLFTGSLIAIDLDKISSDVEIDFQKLKAILLEQDFIPIGIRGGTAEQIVKANEANLFSITLGKGGTSQSFDVKKNVKENNSKCITQPIRSGMQVYAKETDLIVLSQVSPGAELLADGNIHVYGPLRGRILAGVRGNKNARIFCRSLEAELVSIAGFYFTKEELDALPKTSGYMVQIYLENDELKIASIP